MRSQEKYKDEHEGEIWSDCEEKFMEKLNTSNTLK